MNNYNTVFLGIKDIIVESVKDLDDRLIIDIFTKAKNPPCPACGCNNTYVHDYRTQYVKDLPYRGKAVFLALRKRRYRCNGCGKRFLEKYEFLPRYHHMARRVYKSIINRLRENLPLKSVAKEYNVSTNTVSRVFDIVSYSLYKLPPTISIDEFKGNSGGEKYHTILTDPSRGVLLDILKSREKHTVYEYFKGFKQRNHVKYVIMDMWVPYKDLAEYFFANAKIVIDKYHYVRQVYWALDRVRKRVQKNFINEKRVYFKRSRKLFYKSYDKMDDEQKMQLKAMLNQHTDLFNAWQLKEMFSAFMKEKEYGNAKKLLREWILTAQEINLPEFGDCITAFTNWFGYILNSKLTSLTNGFTEGKNNKIKVLKRNAYGYKNFERFRNRILHCG